MSDKEAKEIDANIKNEFKPNKEAQESLSKFLEGLGTTSHAGYLLVDLLDETEE
jgi:hypothetical protein